MGTQGFEFAELKTAAGKVSKCLPEPKKEPFKSCMQQLEDAIKKGDKKEYEKAVKNIKANTRGQTKKEVKDFVLKLGELEKQVKGSKERGIPFSNIKIGVSMEVAGQQLGGAQNGSDQDSLLVDRGNERPTSNARDRSSVNEVLQVGEDREKLFSVCSKLHDACTKYADEKPTTLKYSQKSTSYIKQIDAYADILVKHLEFKSGVKVIKATQQTAQLQEIGAKIEQEAKQTIEWINGWLKKLEDQIDTSKFDEGAFTEKGSGKGKQIDDKKTKKHIEDICIKLKNKQENENTEKKYNMAVDHLEKEINPTNIKDQQRDIHTRIKDCAGKVKEEKEGVLEEVRAMYKTLWDWREGLPGGKKTQLRRKPKNMMKETVTVTVLQEISEITAEVFKINKQDEDDLKSELQEFEQNVNEDWNVKVDIKNESKWPEGNTKFLRSIRVTFLQNRLKHLKKSQQKKKNEATSKERKNIEEQIREMLEKVITEKVPADTTKMLLRLEQLMIENKTNLAELDDIQRQLKEEIDLLRDDVETFDDTSRTHTIKTDKNSSNVLQAIRQARKELNDKKETIGKEIENRKNEGDKKQEEENAQLNDCLDIIEDGMKNIKSTLLGSAFKFKIPEHPSKRKVDEFNDKFQVPLILVLETEDIVIENAKWFLDRFVETEIVVTHLKELFFFICQEDLIVKNLQNTKNGGQKKALHNKDSNETESTNVEEITKAIRENLAERGISAASVAGLRKRTNTFQLEKESHEQEISALTEKTVKQEAELKRLSLKLMQTDEERNTLETKANALEGERQTLLTRLSKIASAKLTDNNPNIADLSDPNRPTKLSEQYSELYDGPWTDAFEVVDKSDDQGKIEFLLNILVDSYKTCKDISRNHQTVLRRAIHTPTAGMEAGKEVKGKETELSAVQSKAMSELRKQTADLSVEDVKRRIKSANKKWFTKKPLENYTTLCIELCWLMNVQSPPVHMETKVKRGSKFDTDIHKPYTKSGKEIDYLVWPVLLLHEGGAILGKGVAQGK